MFTPLFTPGVWRSTLIDLTNLQDYCYEVRSNDKGRSCSNIGGYQSNNLNLSDPHLSSLQLHINEQTREYAKFIRMEINSFRVQNMWININENKDYNEVHTHPGCLFSGVYYISTPDNCGDIEFFQSNSHLQNSHWNGVRFGSYILENSSSWFLPSTKNEVYIFPSFYEHRVQPNQSQSDRISISFNVIEG